MLSLRRHLRWRTLAMGLGIGAATIVVAALVLAPGGAEAWPYDARGSLPAAEPREEVPGSPPPATERTTAVFAERASSIGADPAANLAALRRVQPSLVRVAMTLRYDGGEPPSSLGHRDDDLEELVKAERPLELPGFLVTDDRVLVADAEVHPRFVARIEVVQGEDRVPARPTSWARRVGAVVLTLDRRLPHASPLSFATAVAPPYFAVVHEKRASEWAASLSPAFRSVTLYGDGRSAGWTQGPALIVDGSGTPVGVTMDGWLRVDGSWKGSPLAWPYLDAAERDRLVETTLQRSGEGLLRVRIRLRSPKADASSSRRRYSWEDDDEEDVETERNVVGLALSPRHILVLDRLDAKATARIESLQVFRPDGSATTATFLAAYRDVGAFLAGTTTGTGFVDLCRSPVAQLQADFLLDLRLEVRGDQRVVACTPCRIASFVDGRQGEVLPDTEGSLAHHFLFDAAGRLVAAPVLSRSAAREQYRFRRDRAEWLPATRIGQLWAQPWVHQDPAIVPRPAESEGCLAWLGVETQPLDRELARANGVSEAARDGKVGAIVSYVYDGSPAQRAGLEQGAILLRFHVPDRPAPIDVAVKEDRSRTYDLDDDIADDAKPPWPSAENALNGALGEIGIGNPFALEYAVRGAIRRADLRVEEAPRHYETSPLLRSEPLGATFRDLTYEVRRHFQLDAKAPGVIVSKVDRGSRAAVAGLRRFDILLQVNGQAVSNVALLAEVLATPGDLRLAVKDLLRQRIVKIGPMSR